MSIKNEVPTIDIEKNIEDEVGSIFDLLHELRSLHGSYFKLQIDTAKSVIEHTQKQIVGNILKKWLYS